MPQSPQQEWTKIVLCTDADNISLLHYIESAYPKLYKELKASSVKDNKEVKKAFFEYWGKLHTGYYIIDNPERREGDRTTIAYLDFEEGSILLMGDMFPYLIDEIECTVLNRIDLVKLSKKHRNEAV